MKISLVFITTFINENYIYKFLNSVLENNHDINILIVLVNQTRNRIKVEKINNRVFFHEIMVEKQSLSAARNIGVRYLLNSKIKFDYIQFPDDDSSYDGSFFNKFNDVTIKNENYLIDVFGENTTDLYIPNKKTNNSLIYSIHPQIAMSVNLLIKYDTFLEVLFFDEKMGVGTEFGAGEDSDYFLRCVQISGPFTYSKDLWNYHPKYEIKHKQLSFKVLINKYKNYGKGVIFLHYKHKLYRQAILLCIYAFIGAFYALFFKFDIKLFFARLSAFWYRSITFIMLVFKFVK